MYNMSAFLWCDYENKGFKDLVSLYRVERNLFADNSFKTFLDYIFYKSIVDSVLSAAMFCTFYCSFSGG